MPEISRLAEKWCKKRMPSYWPEELCDEYSDLIWGIVQSIDMYECSRDAEKYVLRKYRRKKKDKNAELDLRGWEEVKAKEDSLALERGLGKFDEWLARSYDFSVHNLKWIDAEFKLEYENSMKIMN